MRPGVGQPVLRPGEPAVGLSADLLADLSDWKINLGTRSFTALSVDMLLRNLRRMVPSTLGYTLVLVAVPGLPEVSITVADGLLVAGQVLSTVTFGLPVSVSPEVIARATFYASAAYAFDRLATLIDDSAIFGSGIVELGGPLEVDVQPGVHGLADHTKVNYAIGVLLARGWSYEESEEHLRRLADERGTLEAAAEHFLATFNA